MKFIILIILILLTSACKQKSKKETPFERDQRLQNEYFYKGTKLNGKNNYYIPRNEISWYFSNKRKLTVDSIQVGDNVSFLDSLGNIIYQAVIYSIDDKDVKLKCLDLNLVEYYIAPLNVDSIRDIRNDKITEIRFYRNTPTAREGLQPSRQQE